MSENPGEFICLKSPTRECWLRIKDIAHVETAGIAGKPAGWLDEYPAIVTVKNQFMNHGDQQWPLTIALNTAQWWQLRPLLEAEK